MSLSGDRLARAEARSALARARFRATATRLKQRLMPSSLLEEALGETRKIGETGAARARQHPVVIAGLTALFAGLAMRWRRRRARSATDAASDSLPTERGAPRRSRRFR